MTSRVQYAFQLLPLLAVILLCAVPAVVGCGGKQKAPIPAEQEALRDEIEGMKGLVSTEPDKGIVGINVSGCEAVNDATIAKFATLPELRNLDVANTKITDASVVHLKKMQNLQELSLSSRTVDKVDTEEGENGQVLRTKSTVSIPLLSPAAVQSLRDALPTLIIHGVEMPDAVAAPIESGLL